MTKNWWHQKWSFPSSILQSSEESWNQKIYHLINFCKILKKRHKKTSSKRGGLVEKQKFFFHYKAALCDPNNILDYPNDILDYPNTILNQNDILDIQNCIFDDHKDIIDVPNNILDNSKYNQKDSSHPGWKILHCYKISIII